MRGRICTTSDDRSVRIWSVQTKNHSSLSVKNGWNDCNINLVHTLFAHTARVWKSLILEEHYMSAGEDSKLCVWNSQGELEKSFQLHQGGGLRGLHYSKELDVVLTGGEDGGIMCMTHSAATCHTFPVSRQINSRAGCPLRVMFLKKKILSTTAHGCLVVEEQEAIDLTELEKSFKNYCLLHASPCQEHVAVASLHGRLLICSRSFPQQEVSFLCFTFFLLFS